LIRLLPYFRLYAIEGQRYLESSLQERAVPLDDALLFVVRSLARAPGNAVATASALGDAQSGVKGALSTLRGLGLIAIGDERIDLAARLNEGVREVPWVDNIELTNICPMECVMCPTGTGRMTRARGHMDVALFQRLVDEIAPTKNGGKPIALHNLGESTLHPRLAEMVRYASERGLVTELSANPGHLPLSLFRALEDAGLSRLIISLDGTDAATLTRVRGKGARGDVAFANLDAILDDRRARAGNVTTRVLIQMIRQRANASQARAFLERYGALSLPLTSAYVKELDANTVDENAGTDDTLYEIGRAERPYLCRAPWRTVVVLWNGDVVPCCHDANGAVVYGNLATSTLADVWAGPIARGLRERLARGAPNASDPCSGCAHRPDTFPMPTVGAGEDVVEEPLHW
jgi:radical SAM protein with 4Fe4S-binding SPASM domain